MLYKTRTKNRQVLKDYEYLVAKVIIIRGHCLSSYVCGYPLRCNSVVNYY